VDELVSGIPQQTDARIYRMTITLVALDAPPDPDYDPTPLIEVSRIGAEVLSFDCEEMLLVEPVCAHCTDDLAEVRERDAVLHALDAIVTAELGSEWTLDGHMARKSELLNIIDTEDK